MRDRRGLDCAVRRGEAGLRDSEAYRSACELVSNEHYREVFQVLTPRKKALTACSTRAIAGRRRGVEIAPRKLPSRYSSVTLPRLEVMPAAANH